MRSTSLHPSQAATMRLSPNDTYALAPDEKIPAPCMLYRAGKSPLPLFDGSALGYRWLPGIAIGESPGK